MKVCLSVGHSPKDGGAINSFTGINEYQYNSLLVQVLREELKLLGHEVVIVSRVDLNTLPSLVNQTNADISVELHCNAYDENTSGSEVLHYPLSTNGIALATFIQDEIVRTLGLRDRGTKASERELLLRQTKMPCVIVEPFFIDKDSDLQLGIRMLTPLAEAIARGINSYASIN